ncbi:MAG: prepilin-type N-terminal cleavage/methylation domain-containing protein [bacterium]
MSRGEAGFTLMEVLVAITILGMSLILIFAILSQSLTALHVDRAYSTAVILAKSKMDEVDLLEELAEGEEGGSSPGGYRWSREITETLGQPEGLDERLTRLFRVRVVVSWPEGSPQRRVTLETLRLWSRPEQRRVGL